jgi:hypothetical protein
MLDVFEDASHGKYQRTVVTASESKHFAKNSGFRLEFKNGQPVVKGIDYVFGSCVNCFMYLS